MLAFLGRRIMFFVRLSLLLVLPLVGCGLTIDIDPQGRDARSDTGMDGGYDGGACVVDRDCDDGLFCNGIESCADGACVNTPGPVCQDSLDCTDDVCDEDADICVQVPNDDRCDSVGCNVGVCDLSVGCITTPDPGVCDDGIHCTIDSCGPMDCEHSPNDADCPSGELCDMAAGCGLPPKCSEAAMCPDRPCSAGVDCVAGRCEYREGGSPDGCSTNPCSSVACDGVSCVVQAPIVCPATGLGSCEEPICVRASDGTAGCGTRGRGGLPCAGADSCSSGTCVGAVCEPSMPCDSTDPCVIPMCSGGTCSRPRMDCGPNAMCDSTTGPATCECAPGWRDCATGTPGCECAIFVDAGVVDASTGCMAGYADCDGDAICECNTGTNVCSANVCRPAIACPSCASRQRCCPCTGMCIPDTAECTDCFSI